MRILQINTFDNLGGAAKVAYSLHKQYISSGHEARLLVKNKYSHDNNVVEMGNNSLSKLSQLSKKILSKDLPSLAYNSFRKAIANDIAYFDNKKIIQVVNNFKPDIIHFHNLHGNYFNLNNLKILSKKAKLVWTLHDMWAITGHCAHSFDCNRWKKQCGKCPYLHVPSRLSWDNTKYLINTKEKTYGDCKISIVCPCDWLSNKVKESILKNHSISTIYNGIDTDIFHTNNRNDKLRKKLNIPLNTFVVLCLATNVTNNLWKGWQYTRKIIQKYSENKDVHFICVGDFESNQIKLNNTSFINYLNNKKQLSSYYQASDVFLLTSTAETFPLTIIEAMASGLPVVSFDVGGVKESIKHKKNGYISKYKNADSLMGGIEWVKNMSIKKKELIASRNRTKAMKDFSLKNMTDSYLNLYSSLLKNE